MQGEGLRYARRVLVYAMEGECLCGFVYMSFETNQSLKQR
jgi:hypothetical protein